MKRFLSVLSAEALKLRRTPVLLLLVLAPYIVTLFFFLFAFFDGRRFLQQGEAWNWLGDSTFTFWCLAVFPMWTAIITAQVATVEHRANGWKRLFTLPVPRLTVYLAKQTLCWLLAAGSFLGLVLAIMLAGVILRLIQPGLGFEEALPFGRLLAFASTAFLASLFLVALQTWLALDRADLATPISIGFLATVSMLALAGLDADLTRFHPWAYPSQVIGSWVAGEVEWVWSLAGLLGGVLFAWVAGRAFVGRDVL